jgi:catechol 2,3-dioxygenase-like lactoylglutathione lyase family enzyme
MGFSEDNRMINIPSNPSLGYWGISALAMLGAMFLGTAFTQNKQPVSDRTSTGSGKVLGLAFDTVQVSNLKRSIAYYQSLGFTLKSEAEPPWNSDEAASRLYRTPGAQFRIVTLTIPKASGQPFTLYLQEFKNIDRSGRVDFPARDPSSPHIGLLEPEADALWAKLKSAGTLRALSWDDKLVRMPGQNSGGIAYVRDPDGFNIEIVGIRLQGAVSTPYNPENPTLHHLGLSVLNSEKSKAFYGGLLGAQFPKDTPEWLSGDMYDAAVGGHGYVIRLINGTFPEAMVPENPSNRFELVEYKTPNRTSIADYRYSDVAVNCVGFQVEGIEAFYSRLKEAGIRILSAGGIVRLKDGSRALIAQDPDVGAFVQLFEK